MPAVARDIAAAVMIDLDAQTAAEATGMVKYRGDVAAFEIDTVQVGV